jgi:hypothetical protein
MRATFLSVVENIEIGIYMSVILPVVVNGFEALLSDLKGGI